MDISYNKLIDDSECLGRLIQEGGIESGYKSIFGIPAGGILPAFVIAQILELPLVEEPEMGTLIVDDLIDSGNTLKPYIDEGYDCAVVYRKKSSPEIESYYCHEFEDEWINLPHEKKEIPIEENVVRLLQFIGEDVNREGLIDTPKRYIKALQELTSGYKMKVEDILTTFDNEDYDEMVLLRNIEFTSLCEHHILPFSGKAHIAYIPNKRIVGISKLARILDIYSKRLQNQERITHQITTALQDHLSPLGVAVVIEASHFCMKCRGVMKQNSSMVTSKMTGAFLEKDNLARQEFLSLISRDN